MVDMVAMIRLPQLTDNIGAGVRMDVQHGSSLSRCEGGQAPKPIGLLHDSQPDRASTMLRNQYNSSCDPGRRMSSHHRRWSASQAWLASGKRQGGTHTGAPEYHKRDKAERHEHGGRPSGDGAEAKGRNEWLSNER